MAEIDDIVRRAVDAVVSLATRASRFAGRILLWVTVVSIGGFLLGIAALSGGIETVWIVLGGAFAALAIGSALVARWRVGAVRRHVPALEAEIRSMITDGRETGQTVIETFIVDEDGDGDGLDRGSAVVLGRRLYAFRGAAGSGLESYGRVTAALTALTTFPLLALAAVAITIVFAVLGFVFLIALAL